MSDFYAMIKEAMIGEEPFTDAGSEALRESVEKFERRIRTVRALAFFAITFATIALVVGVVFFVGADETTSPQVLTGYGALAVFGFSIIGFSKMWFAQMLNHVAIMKELKAVQLRILELGSRTS